MPRKKKPAQDLTTDELARRVFPPKVLKELKRVAHEADEKPKPPSKTKGNKSP